MTEEEPDYIKQKPRVEGLTTKEQERIEHINALLKMHDVKGNGLFFKKKLGPTSKPFIVALLVAVSDRRTLIYREKHFRALSTAERYCHSLMTPK